MEETGESEDRCLDGGLCRGGFVRTERKGVENYDGNDPQQKDEALRDN